MAVFFLSAIVFILIVVILYKLSDKTKFLGAIILPFKLIYRHKLNLFLWLMFVIVGGLLGTIFNLISRCFIHHQSFQEALAQDSATGTFYTFSIVMYASLIGPLFIQAVSPKQPSYRYISVVLLTLLIFALLFCSIFYAYTSQLGVEENLKVLNELKMPIDIAQLLFFILAILFSLYSLGFCFFSEHIDAAHNVSDDSWLSTDDDEVKQMKVKASEMMKAEINSGDVEL